MPVEWLDRIMDEASQLGVSDVIPSTMGEPLLYSGIDEFFMAANRYGLKINLTTNGSFPKRRIGEWSNILIPISRDIKISINGSRKETSEAIMLGSDFNRQIRNIQYLVSARDEEYAKTGWYCSLTLQLTFMQSNIEELSDIVKMACALRVDRVKGHHLWTHFPEIEHLSMKVTPNSIVKWNRYVEQANKVLEQYGQTLPNGKKCRLENFIPLSADTGTHIPEDLECPFLGKELWISATGDISPCCCPDNKRRTLGDFGRYPDVSLSEVVQSASYLKLVADYKTRPVCKVCNMRRKP